MGSFRKYIAIMCSLLILAFSLTACRNNSGAGSAVKSEYAGTTVYGKVTAVKGKKVTLALGKLTQASKLSAGTGSTSGSSKTDTALSGGTPSKPDGTAPSGAPKTGGNTKGGTATSGLPNGGAPGSTGSLFKENGKKLTVTIKDESKIRVQSGNKSTQGSLDDIKVNTILAIKYAEDGSISQITIKSSGTTASAGTSGNSMSGSQTGSITLEGMYTVDADSETSKNKTIVATQSNQNAVLVKNGGNLTISGATLNKTGDTTSEDESNFYGVNSILAATGKSTVIVSDSTLSSAAEGSNAVFATGEGSSIEVSNVKISTTGNSSRGLDATYGGIIKANDVDITTVGTHCAPIATDRGEGTITLINGTLKSSGEGSPCIYSTGNITVTNVTGTATGSQAAVVEGKNSITLKKCNLTGAGKNGIMLYQSTSGDASEGACVFSAADSTLSTTSTGEMFYITNTDAQINLTNTKLNFTSGILINAAGNNINNWGTPGSNPGNVTLTGKNQILDGDIKCDKISSVALKLTKGTKYTGAVDNANTGNVTVSLDSSSKWVVTADSYVTAITDSMEKLSNIESNGFTVYYDSSNSSNSWLNGQTINLDDGGILTPMNE